MWVEICLESLLKRESQVFNKTRELSKHILKVYTLRLGLGFSSIFVGIKNIKICFPIFRVLCERKKIKAQIQVELAYNYPPLTPQIYI